MGHDMHSESIGTFLIERGTLTGKQVAQVLARQREEHRPFGQVAEDMFGVSVSDLAEALAEQLVSKCPWINLIEEQLDEQCLNMIEARDAWESLVLPMRYEGDELLCATTMETLPNAIELIQRAVAEPFRLAIVDIRLLEQFIAERYHFEGIEVDETSPLVI